MNRPANAGAARSPRYGQDSSWPSASSPVPPQSASAELIQAIRTVTAGDAYLSPKVTDAVVSDYVRHVPTDRGTAFGTLTAREREILQLVAEGRSNKEIAALLHVSVKTIEAHRAQVMDKLNIRSVAGLTKFAITEGLTSPEP